MSDRKPYPSNVFDEERALFAPYLMLLPEQAALQEHPILEVFNGPPCVFKTGAPWRWTPTDLPH
jgi:hypothetical protein